MDPRIVCPRCGNEFGDALASEIEERVKRQQDARLRSELERAQREARRAVEKEQAVKLEGLVKNNAALKERLRDADRRELDLLAAKEDLERREEALKLEVARRLAEESARVREEARRQAAEEGELQLREKEKLVADLRHQLEEMKRRVEQGSQQAQGETLEVELEKLLRERFPGDRLEPVAKGARGADVVHEVVNAAGHACGRILWESKRTKAWSGDWIPKLKEDQLRAKASVAAIVATTLPREVRHFGQIDGVWISDFPTAVGMATSLRLALIDRFSAERASSGRADKMEALYGYLMGPEFRQRVEGLILTFRDMRKELDQEQAAIQRMWARREKQIQQFMQHTARLYGDMQGIAHGLPEIPGLSLPGAEQLPLLDGNDDN